MPSNEKEIMMADLQNSSSSEKTPSVDKVNMYFFEFEREPGVKFASKHGFYGDVSHILTFEPKLVRIFLAPFISPDLTGFQSITPWLQHLFILSSTIALMLIITFTSFTDGGYGGGIGCPESDGSINKNVCNLVNVLDDATDDFRTLISFILAGYVAASVAAWGRRRTNYASLCGNARNTNLLLSSLLPLDENNAELMTTRRTLGRWVMLGFELSMLKARGHMDSDQGREFLERKGLMIDGEWEAMCNGDRHTTAFWWVSLACARLKTEGVIPVEYTVRLTAAISNLRGQANDLMSSLDRDKPIPYVAMCGLLVYLNVLIFSTYKAAQWSVWLHAIGSELFFEGRFYVDLFCMFFWNLSYVALYDLGSVLHNPFKDRRLDVAHEAIFGGVNDLSQELANGHKHLPPQLKKTKLC